MSDTIERKSRLIALAYEVLGTIELPPLDASEGEVLAALASAFHSKALVAGDRGLEPPRGKPALPEYTILFNRR